MKVIIITVSSRSLDFSYENGNDDHFLHTSFSFLRRKLGEYPLT